MLHDVEIGSFKVGAAHRHFLIAGPCVIESERLVLETAHRIAEIARALNIPYIFKSSYDKANRTSISSFRGLGIKEGLAILKKVKAQVGVPVLTDVHSVEEAAQAGEAVDVLQIPAFLCRQTDLLAAAAKTGRVVNVKKGQFLSPGEMANVVTKLEESGTQKILLTERGSSFGYNNLVVDILQIPAFLCRQTDLLVEAGKTGRAVNIKKGQFVSPRDILQAAEKVASTGNNSVILTERGSSFGYNNLVVDMRGLKIMRDAGYPVVFDATHSVQLPGGGGTKSSGQREFVAPLACAAAAAGCDGFFMEVHPDPDHAPSDGPNMVPLHDLKTLLERLMRICQAAGKGAESDR